MYLVVFRVFVSTILIFKMTNAELVLYQRSHDDSVDYVLKAVDEKLLDYVCDVLSDFQRFLLCKEILEYNYRGIPYIEEENPYFGSCIEKFVILPSGGKTYKLQPCHGGGPKFNTRTTLLMLYLSSGPQTIIYDTPDELENLTTIPENTFGILYYQDMTTEHHAKGYETVPISYKFGNNRIIERIGKQIPSGRLITSISRQP